MDEGTSNTTTKKDYYKVLEVDYDATDEMIRLNYRRLALKWHPDKHKNDTTVTAKFQEINEAYRGNFVGEDQTGLSVSMLLHRSTSAYRDSHLTGFRTQKRTHWSHVFNIFYSIASMTYRPRMFKSTIGQLWTNSHCGLVAFNCSVK